MASVSSLAEAVPTLVHDGDTVALEGFTHLIPHAAGHEIIRQGRRDLHLVRMTPDIVYDQLIGAGCARKLTFSWGGNPGVGSLHRLRDAVENRWPQPLEIEEHSHAGMATRYAAGASGLPFGVLRGYVGTDLPKHTEHDRDDRVPVHRRGADGRAGDQPRRVDHPRPAGRPRRQRADLGHRRRAEGGGAGRRSGDRHGRGGRRRAHAAARRRRAPRLGDRRRVRGARRRAPELRDGLLACATTPSTRRGTPSPAIATRSPPGSTSTSWATADFAEYRRSVGLDDSVPPALTH